jgi:hypothetical protein
MEAKNKTAVGETSKVGNISAPIFHILPIMHMT